MVSLSEKSLWDCLSQVNDPEIPVISIVDLGIVRAVETRPDGSCEIVITPTYSGCPAMQVIAEDIQQALQKQGLEKIHLRTQLSPAWTTDWISDAGREKLRGFGIAPPARKAIDYKAIDISALSHAEEVEIACPQCASVNTRLISQFGSTACKALYRCSDCLETFDYFKPH
jgi:ring-1,2-phenylacetyl-CoA epoxidase subunit PaaD